MCKESEQYCIYDHFECVKKVSSIVYMINFECVMKVSSIAYMIISNV